LDAAMPYAIAITLTAHKVSTLADKAWNLHVACSACRKGRMWTPSELRAFPANATVGAVLARLVCSCGSRDGAAMLTQNASETQRREIARFNAGGKYDVR
jgi:hypothetical protein